MTVINAKDSILGRLSAVVAKRALQDEKIDIVNCEKALITGKKQEILNRLKEKKQRGNPLKGPFTPTMPDRFVRRTIRGMLPYKQEKGKKAFKNIMCYIGMPKKFETEKIEIIKTAHITSSRAPNTISIEKISKALKK